MSESPTTHNRETDIHAKALDYAKLASRAYDMDDWVAARLGMAFFRGIDEILDQNFETPNYRKIGKGNNWIDWFGGGDQGLDYTIFEHNNESKDVVVAFRGTEPLSLEDWFEDAEQVLGGAEQYKAAVALANRMKKSIDIKNKERGDAVLKKQLSFTGHSLGGGLATEAALATGKQAIVFDAAGISTSTMANTELGLKADNASCVTNYNVKGCFVSDWEGKMDRTTLGTNTLLNVECKQHGQQNWLQNINDCAIFIPKRLMARFGPGKYGDAEEVEAKAETFLCHSWHLFTYQLERRNFIVSQSMSTPPNTVAAALVEESPHLRKKPQRA